MKQEEFNVVVSKTELEAMIFSLRDKTLSYEKSLTEESAKPQPDYEELSFLGYEFHRTYTTLLKLESISERNNLNI